jgi:putative transcriptional regulator
MSRKKIKKGQLLIAEPSILGDHYFTRTVILLAEYNENGSVGFILNKPLEYNIGDLIPNLDSNLTVFNGGPVEQDNLYFIHTVPDKIKDSIEISNGIFWGGDFEALKHLLTENKISKNEIRFFLGYSGWTKNQLDEEIDINSWIVENNLDNNAILYNASVDFWKKKINAQGGNYILFSNAPEDPILN